MQIPSAVIFLLHLISLQFVPEGFAKLVQLIVKTLMHVHKTSSVQLKKIVMELMLWEHAMIMSVLKITAPNVISTLKNAVYRLVLVITSNVLVLVSAVRGQSNVVRMVYVFRVSVIAPTSPVIVLISFIVFWMIEETIVRHRFAQLLLVKPSSIVMVLEQEIALQ